MNDQLSFDCDFLCIGSSPTGQRAAVQAAKLGRRAAVAERGRLIGGICVDTGTIPSKTFREAVLTVAGRARLNDEFVSPGSNRRPSASALLARVAKVELRQAEIIREQLLRNDVAVLTGKAKLSGRAYGCGGQRWSIDGGNSGQYPDCSWYNAGAAARFIRGVGSGGHER
ncbi:MAG: hypothetical protein Nkreftii_000605 [Candidatus Nitrospira kreftii]|uniref:Uncharacterized protein n=1 Tax=Candidatus Nitrospira kreftii TaxID=2652173 RepID=A0A7S8FBL4_9BACT|nr:MAG: hypothetical protein Nkreftii_000605 [Candidatus Nitrospira kreftii]